MSLINDALKKAQKQRTGESEPLAPLPSVGGEPAARIARRVKPVGFNAMLLRLGLGAGGVIVLLVGGYFLFQVLSSPATPKPTVATPGTSKSLPAETVASKTGQTSTIPVVTFSLPVNAATPTPVTADPKPVIAPVVVEAPPVAMVPEPPKLAPPAPKLSPKAAGYIEGLRVAGIRASATDSKVLMNDRVYRVGDMVEHELGLKLVGITANSLTFEGDGGALYTRNF